VRGYLPVVYPLSHLCMKLLTHILVQSIMSQTVNDPNKSP
jgi:hypothetical protein